MEKKLLKSFFSFSMGGYLSLIIGFFTTPVITRIISPEQYGKFSIFTLVSNILLILSLIGLDQGFIRFYYEEKNKKELLKRCVTISLIAFLFIFTFFYFFKDDLIIYLFNETNKKLFILILSYVFILIFYTFSIRIIRMEKKGITYSVLQAMSPVFNFIFIFISYKIYGNNYIILVYSLIFSTLIVTLISIFFEFEKWNFFKNNLEGSRISTKEILKYSYPILITVMVSWLFQSIDKIFIKKYSTLFELGIYAAGFKIIALFKVVSDGFNLFWTPLSFEKYKNNPTERLFYKKVFDYIGLFLFIFALIVLMSKKMIILILGSNYKEAAQIISPLIFIPLMETMSNITSLGIYFKKKSWYHLLVSIIVAVVNIIGNYMLVPKLGAKGAAISTGFSFIIYFIIRTYLSEKLIKFDFSVKRFYFIILLIWIYSIITVFNSNTLMELIFGIVIIIISLGFYLKEAREIIFEIKKYSRRNNK